VLPQVLFPLIAPTQAFANLVTFLGSPVYYR
jgi:hypothetical protein